MVNDSNADEIRPTLYGNSGDGLSSRRYKYKLGDTVRISMATRPFRKGYLPNWTTEVFTVSQRIPRNPPVYKLKDYDGEELLGTFYEHEMQSVTKTDDVYQVEEVLRTRRRRGTTEYLVKWLGYPEKFNSWVSDLLTV